MLNNIPDCTRNIAIAIFAIFIACFLLPVAGHAQTDTLLQKGIDLYEKGDYEQSIKVLQSRLELAIKSKDKKTQKVIYNSLGNNYTNTGKTTEGLRAYEKAITIAEELNDKKKSVGRSLKNIGAMYSDIKDFDKAMQKYDEAEKIAAAIRDTATIADCANNRGVVFEQEKKYNEALAQYSKAIDLYKALNQEDRIAILYNNLGIVYKFLKNYDRSIECYQQSLALSEKMDSKFMIAANQVNIGNVYEMKGDYKMAIQLNEQGLKTGREINSAELVIEALGNLAQDHAKLGNYQKGFDLFKESMVVKDSFMGIERSRQMADMQTKYETEKKELTIISLEKSRLKMLAVIGILTLLLVIAYLLYSRQQARQKQAREKAVLAAEYNERMRIAKDVHDDLGSGLSKISLMANMAQARAATNKQLGNDIGYIVHEAEKLNAKLQQLAGNAGPEALTQVTAALSNIMQRAAIAQKEAAGNVSLGNDVLQIATVSKELIDNMRELIWVLNPENTTLDQLVARLREYCADYLENLPVALQLDFPHEVSDMRITREVQRNIFLTVKEAINNSVKHAHATGIAIALHLDNEKMDLSVTDNGTGFDMAKIKTGGNGLRNMKQRIENIGGTFLIASLPGSTKVAIEIALASIADSKILL